MSIIHRKAVAGTALVATSTGAAALALASSALAVNMDTLKCRSVNR